MFSQIKSDLELLNVNLKNMAGPHHPILYAAAEHLFNAGGKRIRPSIILLVSKATNYHNHINDEQRRLAEITEIIHTASLLHDDVIDECSTRRGLTTVNSQFSNKIAILAGDFLFAQSSWYLANLNNLEVVKIISKVITDFAEGEIKQGLSNFDVSLSIDDYIGKSFQKTASLLASSCKSAAILSNSTLKVQNQFYAYGKHLGLAFQITDDILDITGTYQKMGKPPGLDLKNGNLTAPVLFAIHDCPRLQDLIEREFTEKGDIEKSIRLINETNGIQKAKDLAIEHAQASIEFIKTLPPNPALNDLKFLSYQIINRLS